MAAISAGISIKNKGEKADDILGIYMPFVRATEQMHKPENCWKSLTPFYQNAAWKGRRKGEETQKKQDDSPTAKS